MLRGQTKRLFCQSQANQIIKPITDKKQYKLIELSNKLRAVLISDPIGDKAAMALNVHVGSCHDKLITPSKSTGSSEGIAHFTEHMLFLGTKEYPEEDYYNKYLARHGGRSNAFTSDYDTCYFFNIDHRNLKEASHIFSRFFVNPLFTPSSSGREVEAVNSEHEKNKQVDMWRINQLMHSLRFSQESILNHFGTGNISTLGKDPEELQEKLSEFYNRFYSANIMSLAIVGRESIEELEEIVHSHFSDIVNKNVDIANIELEKAMANSPFFPNPFNIENISNKKFHLIEPVTPNQHKMNIYYWWPVESRQFYSTKLTRIIAHLLGHESQGSLLFRLKEMNLATSLCAGPYFESNGVSVFRLTISLTKPTNYSTIYDYVKEYIATCLMTMSISEYNRIFDETSQIEGIKFDYSAIPDSTDLATHLSNHLPDFNNFNIPENELLSHLTQIDRNSIDKVFEGHCLKEGYEVVYKILNSDSSSFELFKYFINSMNNQHFIDIIDSDMMRELNLPYEQEKWYETKYYRFSEEEFRQISDTNYSLKNHSTPLHLPRLNEYIPTDFSLLNNESQFTNFSIVKAYHDSNGKYTQSINSNLPVIYKNNHFAFYSIDNQFNLPKSILKFTIYIDSVYGDLNKLILSNICTRLFSDYIQQNIGYDAELAGLNGGISTTLYGLSISANGFHNKIPNYLEYLQNLLFKKYLDIFKNTDNVNRIVYKYFRDLKQTEFTARPYNQCIHKIYKTIFNDYFLNSERLSHLSYLISESEKTDNFFTKLLTSHWEGIFINGNRSVESYCLGHTDSQIYMDFINKFDQNHLSVKKPDRHVYSIQKQQFKSSQLGVDPSEPTGAVVIDIHSTPLSSNFITLSEEEQHLELSNVCSLLILNQLLSQSFFDSLRTKQSLGYIVHSTTFSAERIMGPRFIIETEKDIDYVYNQILKFIEKDFIENVISELTLNDYNEVISAVILLLTETPQKLQTVFDWHWHEIDHRRYHFGRKEIIANLLKNEWMGNDKQFFKFKNEIVKNILSSPFIAALTHSRKSASLDLPVLQESDEKILSCL